MCRIIYEGDTINFSIATHPFAARLLSGVVTFNEINNVHKSFTVKRNEIHWCIDLRERTCNKINAFEIQTWSRRDRCTSWFTSLQITRAKTRNGAPGILWTSAKCRNDADGIVDRFASTTSLSLLTRVEFCRGRRKRWIVIVFTMQRRGRVGGQSDGSPRNKSLTRRFLCENGMTILRRRGVAEGSVLCPARRQNNRASNEGWVLARCDGT